MAECSHLLVADGSPEAGPDADAVAVAASGGGLFERLLSGDVTRALSDSSDRPVIPLPAGQT